VKVACCRLRVLLLQGGLRPHAFCLPILKRERHREAVLSAAVGGSTRFFLGTDSAPHPKGAKVRDWRGRAGSGGYRITGCAVPLSAWVVCSVSLKGTSMKVQCGGSWHRVCFLAAAQCYLIDRQTMSPEPRQRSVRPEELLDADFLCRYRRAA
jgi:hypothetical protein